MRGICLVLLCACGSTVSVHEEARDAETHFRAVEGFDPARATPETLAALASRRWTALSNEEAAERFEAVAKGSSPEWIHASELRLLAGGRQNYFLGARDAWRWLAATGGGREQPDAIRRRAYRLYNHNTAGYASRVDWSRDVDRIGQVQVQLRRNGLAKERFSAILPAYVPATKTFSRRIVTSGAGGPVMITFPKSAARDRKWPYLFPDLFTHPLSAVLDFERGKATLSLLDPREGESTSLFGRTVPLKLDYSAAWAYMHDRQAKRFDEEESQGLRRPDRSLQAIYMFSPPHPKRRPVLFVHGLDSSPRAFRNLVHGLSADPRLRANYQLVAYRYASGYSLFINNMMFRSRLKEFFEYLGRTAPAARAAGTVAIGHSMGGLQVKPMAQKSGQLLWDRVFRQPPGRLRLKTKVGRTAREGLIFEPLPEIRRLVFISVPHRGSALAAGILAEIADASIAQDPEVETFKRELVRDYGADLRPAMQKRLAQAITSVDSLKPGDLYLELLLKLPIRVPFHSVIGDIAGSTSDPTSDSVVPYTSAHLEGAVSERIIKWGHNLPASPTCVEELNRILLLHLE